MADWTRSFANAMADIRHKVLEEGWFGKAVTPRAANITLETAGEQFPADKLGWALPGEQVQPSAERGWWRDDAPNRSPGQIGDVAAKEMSAPDRGIDL